MDTHVRGTVDRALEVCPIEVAIAVIGGAWKMTTVKHLSRRTHRFGELRRAVGLRELEQDGIVERRVYAEVPPRVEYSLTPLGMSLSPLVAQLDAWGSTYAGHLEGDGHPPS
jgi:DNA-binding HxlR family transcriptional regulator